MKFSRRTQGQRAPCRSTEICNSWISEALGNKENNYRKGFGVFGSSEIKGGDFVTVSGVQTQPDSKQVEGVRDLTLCTYPDSAQPLSCHTHSPLSTRKVPFLRLLYARHCPEHFLCISSLNLRKSVTVPISQRRKLKVVG